MSSCLNKGRWSDEPNISIYDLRFEDNNRYELKK
jgi:hypothetical protein